MLRFIRNLITLGILATAVAITVASAVGVVRRGLPDEAARRRVTLRELLFFEDLSLADDHGQLIALRRVERALDKGSDHLIQILAEAREHREPLEKNGLVLLRLFLREKSLAWEQAPDDDMKRAQLDRLIDRAERWRGKLGDRLPESMGITRPEGQNGRPEGQGGLPPGMNADALLPLAPLLFARYEPQLQIEDPAERIRIRQFIGALAARLAERRQEE